LKEESSMPANNLQYTNDNSFPEIRKIFRDNGYFLFDFLSDYEKKRLSVVLFHHEPTTFKKPVVGKSFIYFNHQYPSLIWENLPFYPRKKARTRLHKEIFNSMKSSGVPLIQKWYWPNGCRSFFSFRADMDAGNDKSLLRFVDTIRPWSKSLSLFVCGKAYVGKKHLLNAVADLGAEVGNHTFVHYVFSDKGRNRKNIELTETLISDAGISPKGYVGPASFWHPTMYEILEEKGYQYSSSFGIGHDDFPFFLAKNDSEKYSMVEIPFFCLGDRFPKFGFELDSEDVGIFFEQLLEKKYYSCEPMFIYVHPDMPGRMGDCPQLVKRIVEKALSYKDVCTGNMADIAAWWQRRENATANIEFDKVRNRIFATDYHAGSDVFWSIQVTEDSKYLVSGEDFQAGISLDSLNSYKKIDLSDVPFAEVGEVINAPCKKEGLRTQIKNLFREYRRRRKKIHQLNTSVLDVKGGIR
jgi:hypothetical protein